MNRSTIVFSLIILFITFNGYAQQIPVVSQHMFNRLLLNPAYAGSQEEFNASLLHRSQWIGLNESPSTQMLSMDAPLKHHAGLGATIVNDHSGVTDQTDILGSFSFRPGGSDFSFGLRAGFSWYRASLSQAFVWQPEDPLFSGDIKSALLPKFGFGMYYSDGLLFAGLSVPDLLVYDSKDIFRSVDGSARNIRKNYILHAGYTYVLGGEVHLEPSLLVKYHPSFPLLVDVNCNIRLSDKFTAGASYRHNKAFVALVQVKVMDKVKIGYAFDVYHSKSISNYFGTHEIMLSYNLGIE